MHFCFIYIIIYPFLASNVCELFLASCRLAEEEEKNSEWGGGRRRRRHQRKKSGSRVREKKPGVRQLTQRFKQRVSDTVNHLPPLRFVVRNVNI